MITLKVDTKNVEAKLKGLEAKAKDVVQKELNIFAIKTVSDAKRLVPIDEGHLGRSIGFNSYPLKVEVVVSSDYAAYVEFGTRVFAAQYVSSLPATWQQYAATFKGKGGGSYNDFILRIMEWVKRKGIAEESAYLIARKILRTGIRPQPFLFPAISKNLIELKKRLNL